MRDPEDLSDERRDGPLVGFGMRRRRSQGPGRRVAVLVLALLAAGAAWYWLRSRPAPGTEALAPAAATDTAAPPVGTEELALELPAIDESDRFVRGLVGRLSAHPRWAAWLVTDELVRSFVAAVANVAQGRSPTPHLPTLAPGGEFGVREAAGDRLVVDPATYRRYDLLAEVFVSVDTGGAARLYRQLHPLFEEAHRELGFPEGTFDDALARAVANLLAVEVPEAPPDVVPGTEGLAYEFADPRVEARTDAEKHLLRMGPDNARRVQAKLRELADALGMGPVEG